MTNKKERLNKTKSGKSVGGFFVTLLLLLIVGATVFCFGWMQLRVDEGEYAVVYRKSHGYEEDLIRSDDFVWRWEALFPTYLSLHKFNLKPQTTSIKQEGSLPSDRIYSAIIGDDIDFSWEIEAKISYRVNPDNLVSLVRSGFDELDSFYSDFETKLDSAVLDIISKGMAAGEERTLGHDWLSESISESSIDKRVEIVEVSIIKWRYPDMALYFEARRLTLETMRETQAVISEIESRAARLQSTQEVWLKLLGEYGKLLDEYPILIEFFELEGVDIESILSTAIE